MSTVRVEEDAAILRISIDRPDRSNGLSEEMVDDLIVALRRADEDDSIRVVVLAGRGRGFSAGHDLKQPSPTDVIDDHRRLQRSHRQWMAIWDVDVPIVAQVHGYCFGSAMDLLLACDLSLAASSTRFGFPPLRAAGGVPASFAYPYHLGLRRTKELLWVQEDMTAADAVEWGLVNKVVDDDDLDAETTRWAARIAQMPPDNIRLSKQALRRTMDVLGFRAVVGLGVEFDAIAHRSAASDAWRASVAELGLNEAVRRRDERFRRPRSPARRGT